MSEQTSTEATTDAKPEQAADKPKRSYTRKDATTRAREARESAKKKFETIDAKYQEAVQSVTALARQHEVARQDYAYKAANPLLSGDDVEQVPQALEIQPALAGVSVPTGTRTTPVAAETLVGSDGQGTSTTSNVLDEDFDQDAQDDEGSPIDRDQPSSHTV